MPTVSTTKSPNGSDSLDDDTPSAEVTSTETSTVIVPTGTLTTRLTPTPGTRPSLTVTAAPIATAAPTPSSSNDAEPILPIGNLYKVGCQLRKEDVEYDIDHPNKGLTKLGPYSKIKVDLLRGFCKGNNISGYSAMSKLNLMLLIIKFCEGHSLENEIYSKKTPASKKYPATSKPSAVQLPGTYYRFISTYFHESVRSIVDALGNDLTRSELDRGKSIPHASVYDKLSDLYNDTDVGDLDVISSHDLKGHLFDSGIEKDLPSTYDKLEGCDMYHLLRFIERKYAISYRNNKTSGNHDDFEKYVGNDAYLYYFHLRLLESGSSELSAKAVTELPDGLSSTASTACNLVNSEEAGKVKVGKRKKRGVMSPNESRKQYQDSIATSFADKTDILRRSEKSKEKIRELLLGRQKETDRADMMTRLFQYTTNLSKVNQMIGEGRLEFTTMARRYEAEIERLENAMKRGEGEGKKKRRALSPSVLTQNSVRSDSSSDLDSSDSLNRKPAAKPAKSVCDIHISSSDSDDDLD